MNTCQSAHNGSPSVYERMLPLEPLLPMSMALTETIPSITLNTASLECKMFSTLDVTQVSILSYGPYKLNDMICLQSYFPALFTTYLFTTYHIPTSRLYLPPT